MTDVETFDAFRYRFQIERLQQCLETAVETGTVTEGATQGITHVELGKFHPTAAHAARLTGEPHALPGLLAKCPLQPILLGHGVIEINFRGSRLAQVILAEKGGQNFTGLGRFAETRKKHAVAEVAAIADKSNPHCSDALLQHYGNNIGVAVTAAD